MTSAGADLTAVVVTSLGEFRLAFAAARVTTIREAEPPSPGAAPPPVLDLAEFLGLAPEEVGDPALPRRLLAVDRGRDEVLLLAGPTVALETLAPAALQAPPRFLDRLWQRLGVRALIRDQDRLALLLDVDALGAAAGPHPGGESARP